jgi:predicted NBD/HSP70 family sugar kinase
MQDGMKQHDDLAMSLECGHPNVQPNETCPLCGKVVREKQTISASEVGSLDEMLKQAEQNYLDLGEE